MDGWKLRFQLFSRCLQKPAQFFPAYSWSDTWRWWDSRPTAGRIMLHSTSPLSLHLQWLYQAGLSHVRSTASRQCCAGSWSSSGDPPRPAESTSKSREENKSWLSCCSDSHASGHDSPMSACIPLFLHLLLPTLTFTFWGLHTSYSSILATAPVLGNVNARHQGVSSVLYFHHN